MYHGSIILCHVDTLTLCTTQSQVFTTRMLNTFKTLWKKEEMMVTCEKCLKAEFCPVSKSFNPFKDNNKSLRYNELD